MWDLRSVNGRGLDVKIRLPDGAERFESQTREMVAEVVQRGSVTVTLRRSGRDLIAPMPLPDQLDRLFAQIASVQQAALRSGVTLGPVNAAEILDGRLLPRGVNSGATFDPDLITALRPGLQSALVALVAMRENEGQTQLRILTQLIGQISELVAKARDVEKARAAARAETYAAALRRVMSHGAEVEPSRLEQELAILAVKADVAEELNRLAAHVDAARTYLKDTRPVGRKLDFLTQEFNREANTLCAKAQFTDLTRVGLDLKAVIDQLREQVQNVE